MDSKIVEDFLAQEQEFKDKTRRLGFAEVSSYYWYHTIDLGDGLVTPGIYDYRHTVAAFRFPENMKGMTVLDVGSATGFFAFEFEKRGARVVSVELPSLEDLDRFPGQTTDQLLKKIERMILPALPGAAPSPEPSRDRKGAVPDSSQSCKESTWSDRSLSVAARIQHLDSKEIYFRLLEGPFRFCHMRLNSKVERCFSTIYDLSPEKLGVSAFDMVYLGDILLHTFSPWEALAAVAPLVKTGGLLVLSQVMPEDLGPRAAMLYVGGDDPDGDDISWWWPNKPCFEQLLKKMGFKTVEEVGRSNGVLRSTAYPFDRTILHARK